MRSRSVKFVLPLLAAACLPAFAQPGQYPQKLTKPAVPGGVAPPGAMLERGPIIPDLSALMEAETGTADRSAGTVYRSLTASDCKCMAADHAEVAGLIDRERGIAQSCRNDRKKCRQQAGLQAELLALRAAAERNRASGQALELYFLLAEAEAGRDAIAKSKTGVERIREFIARLKEAGLDPGIADTAVDNRWAQVLHKEAQLLLDLQQLNSELRRRLGLDVDDPTPIWPDTDLRVEVAQIDVNAAISEGMVMRPELAATQRLLECLGRDNLAQARGSLQAFEAVLGSAAAPSRLIKLASRSAECCEWAARTQQLEQLLVHLQRSAAEEIRQAAQTVETRLQQIVIAKGRLESREKAVENLQRLWGGEDVSPFEIVDAQLKVVEAETDLIHQVVAWEIARTKLKQAQGLFALECGYTEPPEPVCRPPEDVSPPGNPEEDDDVEIPLPQVPPFGLEDATANSDLQQPRLTAAVSGRQQENMALAIWFMGEASAPRSDVPVERLAGYAVARSVACSAESADRSTRSVAPKRAAAPGRTAPANTGDKSSIEVQDETRVTRKQIRPRPATARHVEPTLPDPSNRFAPVRFRDDIGLVDPLQATSPPQDIPTELRQPRGVATPDRTDGS